MIINLYDFDKTIYAGDSSMDFWLFCLKSNWRLIRFLPTQLLGFLKFFIGICDKRSFKQAYFSFLRGLNNVDELVDNFWKQKSLKIKDWYLKTDKKDDVIISASPDFLLAPKIKQLGCKRLIASRVNHTTGYFLSQNCYGAEKVNRLKSEFKTKVVIAKAYSDSLSDLPILRLAQEAFIVSGDKIINLADYKEGMIKRVFLKKEFLKFLFVGGLNAVLGVSLSLFYTLFVTDILFAFICGFTTSLIPSYFLNTVITFGSREFGWRLFVKFCLSYIPNFIVQVISIVILDQMLGWSKVIIYIISVSVSVPITFALLSIFTFNKKKGEIKYHDKNI